MRFTSELLPATFLERPNRFLGVVELGGARTTCFIPNPGRIHELMVPETRVYLVEKPRISSTLSAAHSTYSAQWVSPRAFISSYLFFPSGVLVLTPSRS